MPYRLPALIETIGGGSRVLIAEGEKDCDNLDALGIPATTNPMGAGKWPGMADKLNPHFTCADVIICCDNDEPGRNHANEVATSLTGIAARIRVLDIEKFWPACPPKGDISDWIAAGGTIEQIDALIERLPDWSPDAEQETAEAAADAPTIHWHGEIRPTESRTWLVQDLIPTVGKGLLSGQWGTYKTFVALDLAHAVMSGSAFLDLDVIRRGGILFVALEGQYEIPVRLQALVDHNGKIEGKAPFAWIESCPSLLADEAIDRLMKTVDQVAAKLRNDFDLPLALIFFDTMILAAGYTKDGADNDTATANAVLKAMALLSQRAGCFVLGVDHFGKAVETGTRGSSAKEGNADLVFALLGERTITGEITDTKLAIRKRRSGGSGQEFPFKPQTSTWASMRAASR